MTDLKPLRDPLEEEAKAMPSYAVQEQQQTKRNSAYLKFLGNKIRTEHPELKEATDEQAIQTIHDVELPNSSEEQFWSVLHDVHGKDFKEPELPFVSVTEPSKVGSMLADIVVGTAQDITAIPKGVAEQIKSDKLAGGRELKEEGGDFRFNQISPTPESQALSEQSMAHLARGGAFAAGLAASAATAGIVNPATSKLGLGVGSKLIPKLIGNTIKASSELGSFLGTYGGIREAEKPEATPQHVLDAFNHGAAEGVKLGPVIALGGAVGGAVVKGIPALIKAADAAGKATREATTLNQAQSAAIKFEKVFQPEWSVGSDLEPKEFATRAMTELYGEDVVTSKVGQRIVKSISEKIEKWQKNIVDNPPEIELIETPNIVKPKTEPVITPGQVKVKVGNFKEGPLWVAQIETEPGTIEVHNVVASTVEKATKKAEAFAKFKGGKLVGEITPQLERRVESEQIGGVGRRIDDLKNSSLEDMLRAIPTANSIERKLILRELMDRPIGVSPYKGENPKNPNNATSWAVYSKSIEERLAKNPDDIALKDEAFRAKSNFEAWQKIQQAKEMVKVKDDAAKEIEIIKNTPSTRLFDLAKKLHPNVDFSGHTPRELRAFLLNSSQAALKGIETPKHVIITRDPKTNQWLAQSPEFQEWLPLPFTPEASSKMVIDDLMKRGFTVHEKLPGEAGFSELALDKDALKRLREAQEKGLIKEDPDLVKKLDLTKIKSKITQPLKNKVVDYVTNYTNAPTIGRWKVFDPYNIRNPEISEFISKTPDYIPLLETLDISISTLEKTLQKFNSLYQRSNFIGFSTSNHFGVNALQKDILINPWIHLDNVELRIKEGITTPDELIDDLSGSIASTILHEITHMAAVGEDTIFSRELTFNVGRTIDIMKTIKDQIKGTLNENLLSIIKKHKEILNNESK